MPPPVTAFAPGRIHTRRLREIYRSAGWPCQDLVEVELLAAGLVERVRSAQGHETLRVTEAGIAAIATSLAGNRAARDPHEALVARVALEMQRAGRVVWRGLALRARVPCDPPVTALDAPAPEAAQRWCMAMPDVFSIRNTTVEHYVEPIVHEVKARRADLLADLRRPAKRAAYLDMASECWYVLGQDARGRPIAAADEVPPECGVLLAQGDALVVARPAPRRAAVLPFGTWMALAKATPLPAPDGEGQGWLGGEGAPC